MALFNIAMLLLIISIVESASINIIASNTNLYEGDSVIFTIEVDLLQNEGIINIAASKNKNEYISKSPNFLQLVSDLKTIFSDRISGGKANLNYLLKINNLRTSDSMTITIVFTCRNTVTGATEDITQSLIIDVKADPVIYSFPERLYIKEGNTVFLNSTIYGRPRPGSYLVYGGQTFRANQVIDLNNNTYQFVFTLRAFYADNCGSVLLLNVFGNGKTVNKMATVFVLFTAELIKLLLPVVQLPCNLPIDLKCNLPIELKWKPVPSGTCPVTYNIEFLNSINQTVIQFYGITNTSFSTTNDYNATQIKMYAVFNGISGFVLHETILNSTDTPMTSTSPATTATADIREFLKATNDYITVKISLISGIAVGVFVFFVGLIVASFGCGFHWNKKETNLKSNALSLNGETVVENNKATYC